MKKVLLSLLAVAALVLSCQNYDDEFAALNTKISSLESQITSLAELRTAVTGVQSSISALQSAVAAAQAAAEAADNSDAITALATSVSAIAADLVELQSAIAGATTEADLDALKDELNTTLAALQALIETNSASIASLVASNADLKDALEELGVDVDSVLAANASFEGNLTITNVSELAYAKSLGNKVSTIKGNLYVLVDASSHTSGGSGTGLKAADVNSVLSQITYVVGDVKIDSDESLDLSKLGSVSGDYIVLNHDVQDDALVSVGDDVYFNYDGPYTSNIQTADNIYIVMKPSFVGSATSAAETGTTTVDFSALTRASGVQSVDGGSTSAHTSGGSISTGSDVDTKTITTVGTTVTNVTTSIKIGQAPVIRVTGNSLTSLELHYAADLGAAASGLNVDGVAALGSLRIDGTALTSIKVMAAQITGSVDINTKATVLTAAKANVEMPNLLTAATTAGTTFNSDALDHSMSKVTRLGSLELSDDLAVALPVLTEVNGVISLGKATSFSASELVRVARRRTADEITAGTADYEIVGSAITANAVTGSMSFPKLTKAGGVNMDLVTSFSAPLAKISSIDIEEAEFSGTLSSSTAETVTLPIVINVGSVSDFGASPYSVTTATSFPNANAITSLTLNAQDVALDLTAFTNARTISYTQKGLSNGDANGDITISSANVDLTSLTVGGVNGTVTIDYNASVGTDFDTTVGVATSTTGDRNIGTALATINTSGTIESLIVRDSYDLVTLNALHTNSTFESTAPSLVVVNNKNLTTLKTGIVSFSTVTITGNLKLSSLDLSSIVSLPANWVSPSAVSLTVKNNYQDGSANSAVTYYGGTIAGLPDRSTTAPLSTYTGMTGDYTAASSVTAERYTQAGLATLSTFFQSLQTKFLGTGAASAVSTGISIDLNYAWHNDISNNRVEFFGSAPSSSIRNGALDASGNGTSVFTATDAIANEITGQSVFTNFLLIQ